MTLLTETKLERGNNIIDGTINGIVGLVKQGEEVQSLLMGNGMGGNPENCLLLKSEFPLENIYNEITLNKSNLSICRKNLDQSIITGIYFFTNNSPTSDTAINYTQWGVGLQNEHDPNKIVMQNFTLTSGEIAFHIRRGSKVRWYGLEIFNSIEEAKLQGYTMYDTFLTGPTFTHPNGSTVPPGTHITIID